MKPLPFLALLLPLAPLAAATQLPDVAVSGVGSFNDWRYYGQSGGIAAYSFATTSCNVGNAPIDWQPAFDMPVIGQNLLRVVDGHIEQLGYSFLKDSFCAINEPSCGNCQATPCSTLGVGCADTYCAGLNDGANGWGKWPIDANRGTWSSLPPGPSGDPLVINGRLQVEVAKLGDPGSVYVAEGQYVSGHDQQAGLGQNNQSWRYVNLTVPSAPSNQGGMHVFEPALFAWRDVHPDVLVSEANLVDEGGTGVHGFMWVGSKATDLGGGLWRYDYAVQNTTSRASVGSLTVRASCGVGNLASPVARGVRHHSGSPYSNAPWGFNQTATTATWFTETFQQNPNASAVRWGELHSFAFVTDSVPDANGAVELGLFQAIGSISAQAIVPSGPGFSYPSFCVPANHSFGYPCEILASGTPVIAANDIRLDVVLLPPMQFGYFLMSRNQQLTPSPPGSQGNLCLANPIVRFSSDILNSSFFGAVEFHPDATALPNGTQWQLGETWNFQYWTRDGQNPSNFSAIATITFCQ